MRFSSLIPSGNRRRNARPETVEHRYDFVPKIELLEDRTVPAGITVTPIGTPWTTGEDARTASFDVVLDSQPTAEVTIAVSSDDTTEGTLSIASLSFDSSNWNVAQTVTVTGEDDATVDDHVAYSIVIGPASSGDAAYNGLDPADLPAVNLDNDAPGFLYLTETYDLITTRMRLDGSQVETLLDMNALFPGAAFNHRHIAIDHSGGKMYWTDASGKAVRRSNLDGSGAETLLTNTEIGYRGIDVDPTGGKMYFVKGDKIQRANLDGTQIEDLITGSTTDGFKGIALNLVGGKIYFTDRWEDTISRADLDGSNVEILWTGDKPSGSRWIALDVAGGKMYWSSKTGANATNGHEDVIRRANLDGTDAEIIVDGATLGENHNAIRGIAVDPAAGKLYWADNGTYGENGVTDTVRVANLDGSNIITLAETGRVLRAIAIYHPEPGISVTNRTGLITGEDGTTDEFRITVNTKPTANVTIDLTSDDPTEGTVSVGSVTFTPDNWNVTQTVTITGVDDGDVDGDVAYGIVTGVAVSADVDYNGLNPADVSVTNLDNEHTTTTYASTDVPKTLKDAKGNNPGTTTSTLTITDSFDVLDVNVHLDITHTWNEDLDVFLISPGGTRVELFTDVGGSTANFTGTILDDQASTSITFGTAPFTGTFQPEGLLSDFNGESMAGTWTLEIQDDEKFYVGTLNSWSLEILHPLPQPGITVTPTSGLQTTEGGGTASFTVVLDTQPTADVTLGISSNDTTEGTVDASSLTFTSSNWDQPQTVTIIGVDDALIDGNVAYEILTAAATSSDAAYNGLNAADVSVTNDDDEGSSSTAMYVSEIVVTQKQKGNKHDARVKVTIFQDSNGSGTADAGDTALVNASVTINVSPTIGDLTGTTDSNGSFQTAWFRVTAGTSYLAEVTAIMLTDFEWDHDLDQVSDSDSNNLPDVSFTAGNPLQAADVPTVPATDGFLTMSDLEPMVQESIARWNANGLSADQVTLLNSVDVQITDLGGSYLGMQAATTIWIDDDAAGWGWFVDPTPWEDSEFTTPGDQGEQDRIDLLSVLMHEVGHLLGYEHDDHGVMSETLAEGTRLSFTGEPQFLVHDTPLDESGFEVNPLDRFFAQWVTNRMSRDASS